ncbi:Eukaryotic peptide chain release factor GTP-binding subunit [Nymphaea thermarum]|nr:Eukaryotic peptide chain release factor GTP-binding subunit [Nymphaea thermarum]
MDDIQASLRELGLEPNAKENEHDDSENFEELREKDEELEQHPNVVDGAHVADGGHVDTVENVQSGMHNVEPEPNEYENEVAAPENVEEEEEEEKEVNTKRHLNVVFIGHVDAGKSTCGGQILFLSGMVDDRTIQKYEKEAKDKSRESWYMAYIMDTNEEERIKGKTVEVGRAHFETETTRFTILDAPGHKSYVPNMISGASQADIGVLVISARKGEFETGYERGGQTREHVQLAKTLGVTKLVVVVNKMDDSTVKWSKDRFDEIESKMIPFLRSSGYNVKKDVQFLPISGLVGSNIKTRIEKSVCGWWNGPCLFEVLDTVEVPPRDPKGPLRMPIIDKFKDMGTVVMGKIESGSIREGDSLLVMPNKASVKVLGLYCDENKVRRAGPGENVRVRLSGIEEDDILGGFVLSSIYNSCFEPDFKQGMLFLISVHGTVNFGTGSPYEHLKTKPISAVSEFDAQLQILELLDNAIFTAGYKAVLHIHSIVEECEIVELLQQIDPKTKKPMKKKVLFVKNGAVVVCRIQVNNLICIETFSDFPQLGRFTLRSEGKTVAVGKVTGLRPSGTT